MREPGVPGVVSVAMDEIVADVREGLLAIAVGAGMQVLTAMMAADVEVLCGPRGRHDPQRAAVRHGSETGSVSLGGRRVPVRRPRVRTVDGSAELPVASYELFAGSELLGREALEQMLEVVPKLDELRDNLPWAPLRVTIRVTTAVR